MASIHKNIDLSEIPMFNVSEDAAKEYIDFRMQIKKPLTQRAFSRALKEAARCFDLGITASEALEITIDKGWQGVVYEYIKNELSRRGEAANGGHRLSFGEQSDQAYLAYKRNLQ